jgi:hypothetical protein
MEKWVSVTRPGIVQGGVMSRRGREKKFRINLRAKLRNVLLSTLSGDPHVLGHLRHD